MKIEMIDIGVLNPSEYNPRLWDEKAVKDLTESVKRFGLVDPIIANKAPGRENIVIGGHLRLHVAKLLGFTEVPVYFIEIPEIAREMELNLRLNKNVAAWDWNLLANFGEEMLIDSGFDQDEVDRHFNPGGIAGDEGDGCARCKDIYKSIRGHIHSSGHTFKDIVGDIPDMKPEE